MLDIAVREDYSYINKYVVYYILYVMLYEIVRKVVTGLWFGNQNCS